MVDEVKGFARPQARPRGVGVKAALCPGADGLAQVGTRC